MTWILKKCSLHLKTFYDQADFIPYRYLLILVQDPKYEAYKEDQIRLILVRVS